MLKQSLQQKLSQKLSPQQIKLMKLIQLPTIELEQKVKEEIEANPAIEEGVEQAETSEFEDHDEREDQRIEADEINVCLLYTSPSPRDYAASRMPSSA